MRRRSPTPLPLPGRERPLRSLQLRGRRRTIPRRTQLRAEPVRRGHPASRRMDHHHGRFAYLTMKTLSMQRGFSLVEMMIAMTIGLMITAGLVTVFANTSNSQAELRRTSQQIENGRYAMDVLSQDLQVTGYFGSWRKIVAPATAPDPCSLTVGVSAGDVKDGVNLPVQAYNAASLTAWPSLPASCAA